MSVEPFGCVFDTKRPGYAVTLGVNLEDEADQFSLNWIDFKPLLDFGAAPLGLNNPVSERRPGAIPSPIRALRG